MALIFKRFFPICLFFYHLAYATDTLIPSGFTELGTANIGNANIGSFGGINSNPASIYFHEEFTEKSYGAAFYEVIYLATSSPSIYDFKINQKTNQVPVAAAKTLKLNDRSQFSFFIAMNQQLYSEKHLGMKIEDSFGNIYLRMKLTSNLIGFNYSYLYNESFKLGVHFSYKEIHSEIFGLAKFQSLNETISSAEFIENHANTIQPKFGIIYSADDVNDFGLFFTTNRLSTYSYENKFNIDVSTNGTVSDESKSENNQSNYLFSDQISIGYKHTFKDLESTIDLNQSFGSKDQTMNDASDSFQKSKYYDYGIGINYHLGQNNLLFGYHKYDQDPFTSQISLGFKTKRKNIEDVFGCYYFDSDSNVKIIRYGIFYSSMYTL